MRIALLYLFTLLSTQCLANWPQDLTHLSSSIMQESRAIHPKVLNALEKDIQTMFERLNIHTQVVILNHQSTPALVQQYQDIRTKYGLQTAALVVMALDKKSVVIGVPGGKFLRVRKSVRSLKSSSAEWAVASALEQISKHYGEKITFQGPIAIQEKSETADWIQNLLALILIGSLVPALFWGRSVFRSNTSLT